MINPALEELSKLKFTHPASVHPEVGQFLYSLTRNLRPQVVVEIGSFIGYSSICFAQAIEDNKQEEGIVYAIDLFEPHKSVPGVRDWEVNNPLEIAETFTEKAGLSHRIEFIKGSSSEVSSDLLGKIKKIDILFIDGNHSYRGVLSDYNLYHGKVRKGGLIIFHDIYPGKCSFWGPRILLNTLKRQYFKTRYQILEMDTVDGYGMAVCKKMIDGRSPVSDNFILENIRKAYTFYREGGKLSEIINHVRNGGKFSDFYTRV